jgi:hypothetical protein
MAGISSRRVLVTTLMAVEPESFAHQKGALSFRSWGRGDAFLSRCAPVAVQTALEHVCKDVAARCTHEFSVLTNAEEIKASLAKDGIASRMLPASLLNAVAQRRERAGTTGNAEDRSFWNLQNFYKIAIVSYTEYEWVCQQDLDVILQADPLLWMLRDQKVCLCCVRRRS